ncbi:WbqC family protein [Colwelliaceae bacterium 6441]
MKCAIMQPTYLPWCGYFNLIHSVDKFIFLDDVKLEKSNWQVRNRIKSANGELMLSLSVNLPHGRMNTMINQAQLDFTRTCKVKHLKSIYTNYRKSPYFEQIFPFIEAQILSSHSQLSHFTIDIIKSIAKELHIDTEFYLASEISHSDKVKDERLVEICNQVGANEYISPIGAANYIEKTSPGGAIAKNGITLTYQKFPHPVYPQLYGEFISHLSMIDMLFNCGFYQSSKLIKQK